MEAGMMETAYHETKEHGGREFPFTIYPCFLSGSQGLVGLHWHEEMEIISVKKGRGSIVVDTVVYHVSEGDILAVYPGQLHSIKGEAGERMEYENIIFRLSMLMAGEEDICTKRFLLPLARGLVRAPLYKTSVMEDYGGFQNCIRRLDQISEHRLPGYQLAVKGQLFQFLYLMVQTASSGETDSPRPSREKIKQVLAWIEERYGEQLTVEQAAELCYYSKSHFMKYFKQYAGMPFIRYLNDYRLEQAAVRLKSGWEPVTEIASRCGFDNLSYFNRLFRKKYAMTPTEYRALETAAIEGGV